MAGQRYVRVLIARILRETDKAFYVLLRGKRHWLPKSQINNPDDYCVDDMDVEMEITVWLAEQKRIEDEQCY